MRHCNATRDIYEEALKLKGEAQGSIGGLEKSLPLKAGALNMPLGPLFLAPLAFQMITRKGGDSNEDGGNGFGASMINSMGLMQWGVIGMQVLYFLTYVPDAWIAVGWEKPVSAAGIEAVEKQNDVKKDQ